jgi:hypothetical protein
VGLTDGATERLDAEILVKLRICIKSLELREHRHGASVPWLLLPLRLWYDLGLLDAVDSSGTGEAGRRQQWAQEHWPGSEADERTGCGRMEWLFNQHKLRSMRPQARERMGTAREFPDESQRHCPAWLTGGAGAEGRPRLASAEHRSGGKNSRTCMPIRLLCPLLCCLFPSLPLPAAFTLGGFSSFLLVELTRPQRHTQARRKGTRIRFGARTVV